MDKAEGRVLLLYLLKQINNICESEKIPYYASGGTCLGAIRHKGFIPWDDDIDIMIQRKYYDNFVSACETKLSDPVVLRTRENDRFFCQEYTKLCFKDDKLRYSDISIDVFFLDETDPGRKLFRAIQNRILIDLYYIKLYKVSKDGKGSRYTPKNKFKRLWLSVMSVLPYSFIDIVHKKTMIAQKKKTEYWINWGSCYSYKKATYKKTALGKPQKMPFENTYIYVAENPEEILTHLYGPDYMTPPPVDKRTDHGVRKLNCSSLDFETIKKEIGE